MEDGIIQLDTPFAKKIEFTSDKFSSSWLWKRGKYIWISMVIATKRNKGYTQSLFKNILKEGFNIKVPTPMNSMYYILKKMDFKPTVEVGEEGECEVWIKEVT